MTPRSPDFDELVGSEVDVTERDRLRRVHDLLVAAGPPPDLATTTVPAVETPAPAPRLRRRRRTLVAALAAALGLGAAFTIGLALAAGDETSPDRVYAMSGPGGATGSLEVYDLDDAGNWPMLFEVDNLPPADKLYELWLTKDGEPAALCGSFKTDESGKAVVPMNAPWRFDEFDGWVVVESGADEPVLETTLTA